jgi:hypothetical protein
MFINNKYTAWYYKIITARQQYPITAGERHHIVPRCLGGSNKSDNIVRLTDREHYICHQLLVKMTAGVACQKLWLALDCFTKSIQDRPGVRVSSRVVANARLQSRAYLSSIRKGNATRPAGTYTHSKETRQKQSVAAQGVVKRPAGYSHSAATIDLMRQNRRGKNLGVPSWNKGISQVCPHCLKTVGGTLNRWHGDRCPLKPGA